MRLTWATWFAAGLLGAGEAKHLFNARGAMTGANPGPVNAIALDFTRQAASSEFQLGPQDFAGVFLDEQFKTEHNGVTHFRYRQRFEGIDVYNAAWTVNIDRDGRVLNAGGLLFPRPETGFASPLGASKSAAKTARLTVDPGGRASSSEEGRPVWFGLRGRLRAAWLFYVTEENGLDLHASLIDAANGKALFNESLTLRQARGLVFERESPQPNPKPGVVTIAPPPFVDRTVQPFTGDPGSSPRGWISGVTTSGNNAHVSANPLGTLFDRTLTVATAQDLNFSFPLEHGPGSASLLGYQDASMANLFYWVNRSHDLFYQLGFNEAAANFQQDNFGRGGIGGDAILAYSFFGAGGLGGAPLSNAAYIQRGTADGSPAMLAFFLSYGADRGFTDNSFDAITVIHEYTHGVSHRLVKQLTGFHGRAMGEALSDFYSLEFTLPDSAPPDGVYPYSEYPEQAWGLGIRSRPYTTNMDVNPLTFREFGKVFQFPEVHADGEIFVEALWEVRANLIRQHGEREGRRRVRQVVLDGMKLSPPNPTFIDMRDAILLADRASFTGASQQQIWQGFAKRGLGVLAYASSPSTAYVVPSFELPSNTGQLRFHDALFSQGEAVRVILHDGNLAGQTAAISLTSSSGDIEEMRLQRFGLIYIGAIGTSASPVSPGSGVLNLGTGDAITAYYTDVDTAPGSTQVEVTANTIPPISLLLGNPSFQFTGEQNLNFRAPFLARRLYTLPFASPFYGEKHGQVWIYANGLLAFNQPVLTPCTDITSLGAYKGIAPLWHEMNTFGTAQPNEGVFVSRPSPDAITFRWAGGTDVFAGFNPEPVNFAVTLWEDGRIRYQYGAGNRNLGIGQLNSSCGSVSTPTVGISSGHDIYSLYFSTHSGLSNLENARTINIDPPYGGGTIPSGVIDAPAAGAESQDVLTVSGAVFDAFSQITRVEVFIDGVHRARATLAAGGPHPECVQRRLPVCNQFRAILNTARSGLPEGEHELRIRVTNTRGGFSDFPAEPLRFHTSPGTSRTAAGGIDAPIRGATVSGTFLVRGWTFVPNLQVSWVDVIIDGAAYTRAPYGFPRTDVCNEIDPRPTACPGIGFEARVDSLTGPVPLVNGEHKLQFRVLDSGGRFVTLPAEPVTFTVNNVENQDPIGVLVSHKNNDKLSGKVTLSGHAWDPDGTVRQIVLVVNESVRGNARYGLPRPEECAELPDIAACPAIGFEIELDTTVLPNGLTSLYLLAVDDKGAVTQFPRPANAGINLYVEN
ncbi:MAG: hypothetical protein FJW39_03385 [Acidobacteria bacterium]|nr:hypothetical protein [Acidobacteriota bacterium]